MRRSLFVVCLLLSLLLAVGFIQHVAAETPSESQSLKSVFSTSPAIFTTPGKVNTLVPFSDGRMLVGGSFVAIGEQSTPRSLAILKSDGSLDSTFRVDSRLQVYEVYAAEVQPDGKIVIAGWFTITPTPATYFLLRLNPNGALDDAFTSKAYSINGQVFSLLMDGDKILIGGNFISPTPHIARLNQDGTADSTFNNVGSGPDDIVRGIARQSSGQYIIVGDFSSVNGVSQVGVARLNANGSLDGSFVSGGFRVSKEVEVLNDDSVLVGGENVCGDGLFAWYTSNGSPKPTLDPNPDNLNSITSFLPLSDGGFLIGGWYSAVCVNGSPTEHVGEVWRYASDGTFQTMVSFGSEADILALALRSDGMGVVGGQGRPETSAEVGLFDGLAMLDLAFDGLEKVADFKPVVGDEAEITSLSRYSDGRMLVAGNFSHVNSLPRFGLARLLANSSLDTGFQPFTHLPGGWSNAVLALPDGRVVAGFAHSYLYLIDEGGSLTDLSVINNYDRVSTLALQSDGKVLVGSDFGMGLRRLKADFTGVDPTFVPGDTYGSVYALAVQGDGKIVVAGDFEKYNNQNVPGLVRLTDTGILDGTFVPPTFMVTDYLTGTLYSLTPLASGQLLVGGDFTTIDGEAYAALARLDSNGSQDLSFSSPSEFNTVRSTCVQEDGSIWIGGTDASYFRYPLLLHSTVDGLVDSTFDEQYQAAHDDGVVNVVLCETDSIGWAGGIFNLIDNRPFYSIARYFELVSQVHLPLILR